MADDERIGTLISDVERYMSDLEEMGISSADDLSEKKDYYSASMILFSLMNRCIDLGEEILSINKLGVPKSYRDIFKILKDKSIIDNILYEKLSDIVYYRNMLAHEYQEYTADDVFKMAEESSCINDFVEAVRPFARGKSD